MQKLRASVLVVVAALAQASCSNGLAQHSLTQLPSRVQAPDHKLIAAYGQLPLGFEANKGQVDRRVDFQARGPGYAVFLMAAEAVLVVPTRTADSKNPRRSSVVSMQLIGANRSPRVRTEDPLPGSINYFHGAVGAQSTTNVRQYARVRYDAVYPGIDVVYYGQTGRLEHDFIVGPGADPGAIDLRFEGAEKLEIDDSGDLVLYIGGGQMRLAKPRMYQRAGSIVAGNYVRKSERDVAFKVGAYDRSEPLIIDPVLEYSTHVGGGTLDDFFNRSAIAVDASGSAYITGQALAFPTTPGSFQPISHGDDEVFVAKLAPDGSHLIYATFIGGSSYDLGSGIAVDAAGHAYVTGQTFSADFPRTPGALNSGVTNGAAFVAKLSTDGSSLLYSARVGSAENDRGSAIAVDISGNAYITGERLTAGAFVTKVNATATGIVYSGLIGAERGRGIAVDSQGSAYVTGDVSSGLPASAGAFQTSPGGGGDAFLIKLNPSGSGFVYATYLGGTGHEYGADIAIDSDGNAYVTGETTSYDFPVTSDAFQQHQEGVYPSAAFVSKVNPSGSIVLYSTLLASFNPLANSSHARGSGIAVDASRNVYITGTGDVPPVDSFQSVSFGPSDAFVAKLNPALSGAAGLVFATSLGGDTTDQGHDIAVDPSGNAYVSGRTRSANFLTVDPLQSTLGGGFVAKIAPAAAFADLGVTITAAPDPVTIGGDLTYTVTVTNAGPNDASHVDVIDRPPSADIVSFSASQGSCTRDSGTAAQPITCGVGPLAVGAAATVTVVTRLSYYSVFTNSATVRSNVSDPNRADNSAATNVMPVGPPIASFWYECIDFTCSFDASSSSDNGMMSSYAWDFGDGVTSSGRTTSHTYAVADTFSVTLTVTDDDGFIGAQTQTLTVPVANPNAPYADFVFTCDGSTCSFDASNSWSPYGVIVAYDWDFGDGAIASDISVTHTFARGAYIVTLTVTDDQGLTGVSQQNVDIGGNAVPVAAFTWSCAGLTCSFDSAGSSDSDGTIASYSWDFGDGQSGSGSAVGHTYAGYGGRTVTLTVADNGGATGQQSQVVNLVNAPPVAAFTSTCSGLACSFNGVGSSDPDGAIASYSWNFGDGQSGSGSSVSHAYAVGGGYTVTLVVTDNGGATNAHSANVAVTSPSVHIGDLDGAATSQQNLWTAAVTATVHDGAYAPLANAVVSGSWSSGGSSSCTTNSSGRCTLSAAANPKRVGSVTFTVSSVTHATSTYMPGQNRDPDGDSDGTSIRVLKP